MPHLLAALSLTFFSAHAAVEAPEKAKVLVQELQPTEDTKRLLIPVKVEAKLATTVTAEAEGLVTRIRKPLGTKVKAGEVVLFIENKDPAFTYAAVPVRAPVAGVVSQLYPALLSKVTRGDKLFSVINPKTLKLKAEIPGGDLALIEPATEGQFQSPLPGKKGMPVRVVGVSPLVDPRTGTASAELEFTGEGDFPAIGSVGHVLFEKSRGKVLLVPESAIGYLEGKPRISILQGDGTVLKKFVELGEQKESQLVVKEGLSPGDKLIVRTSRPVKEGEAVDVESQK